MNKKTSILSLVFIFLLIGAWYLLKTEQVSKISLVNNNTQDYGRFIYPASEGEVLNIGQTVNLQWQLLQKYPGERYGIQIYLVDQNNQKVSTSSILYWNYAKNGETVGTWKVGHIPGKDSFVAIAGKYKLLLEHTGFENNDADTAHSFSSPLFQIAEQSIKGTISYRTNGTMFLVTPEDRNFYRLEVQESTIIKGIPENLFNKTTKALIKEAGQQYPWYGLIGDLSAYIKEGAMIQVQGTIDATRLQIIASEIQL